MPNENGELPPFEVKAESPSVRLFADGGGQGFLLRVGPDGFARREWRSAVGAVFSLAPINDEHWLLGTNDKGRLYTFSTRHEWGLLHEVPNGGEISAILRGANEGAPFYLFTSNPAAVYQLGGPSSVSSSFTSDVLDARESVRWGRLETAFAREGEVAIETRTGLTDEPDSTWSDWQALEDDHVASPPGRFAQYRLEFPSDSEALFLRARLFHTTPNAAPVFTQLRVLDYGAEARSNSGAPQMFDLSTVFKESSQNANTRGGERFKLERRPELTFRTVVWMATDPNGDELRFEVAVQAVGEETWTLLAKNLSEPSFLFNAAGFEPGEYRFKVKASDAESNTPTDALSAELVSELVRLDTTPPSIEYLGLEDGVVRFKVESDVSRMVAAQITVDGEPPISLRPLDGIFDDLSEEFSLKLPAESEGNLSIVFEALDESGNQAVFPLQLTLD